MYAGGTLLKEEKAESRGCFVVEEPAMRNSEVVQKKWKKKNGNNGV
jgi:hypothetical protein